MHSQFKFHTMKELNIKESQKILLEIAKEFHRICQKHNIPYYMIGGTMLGAIRHKGFIPWDDDMDFGIMRKDYETFKNACKKEFPPYYKFLHIDNSSYAILGINKIVDTRTKSTEIYSIKSDETIGLYIDVFVLESTDSHFHLFSLNKRARYAFKLQKLLFINPKNRPLCKKMLAKFATMLIPLNKSTLIKYISGKYKKKGNNIKNTHVFNWAGAYGYKELIPKTLLGKPTLYKFEDIQLYGPENYEKYLKHFYNNYMQLPSVESRHTHFNNVRIND